MGCRLSKYDGEEDVGDGRRLLAGEDDMPHPQSGANMMTMQKVSAPKESSREPPPASSSRTSSSSSNSQMKKNGAPPPKKPNPPPQPQQAPPQKPPAAKPPAPAKPPQTKSINTAANRIDAIKESVEIENRDIRYRYAYLSQRGRYPDDPYKPNQDAYCVEGHISGKNNAMPDCFYGVMDGHGKDGDGCAQFVKRELPKNMKVELDAAKAAVAKAAAEAGEMPVTDLSKDQVQSAILKAHVQTNKELHKEASIDDSLSGTTSISLYFHGRRNRITIANVGDSRAVLGQKSQNPRGRAGLKAYPLSRDQTPYRRDEKKRVKEAGARILSLDQLEGLEPINDASENDEDEMVLGEELDEGGDPPRVWAQDAELPGCAFTRSLGDAIAEDLGVFAEPEMLTREICPDDRIIVLASDGVFEFLTNQSVIDICAKFGDPLEACRAVVAEAYELWLQYELRTDDITIIVLFIDDVRQNYDPRRSSLTHGPTANGLPHIPSRMPSIKKVVNDDPSSAHEEDEVDNVALTSEGMKPVRKKVSKEKSKEIEKLKEMGRKMQQQEETFDWRKLMSPKSEDEKKSIEEAIKASVMFRQINVAQREMIFSCMESVKVKAGDWVIKQGSVGDRFYIIDEGRFEVRILPDGEEDVNGDGGPAVHVYHGSRETNAHPAFGELALMYSAPRSASIVAQSDGHLWALHRAAFRQVLVQAQDHRQELKKVLGDIPYFQYLDADGITKLAAIMDEKTFGRGENITEQGRPGKYMYVIRSGSCYTTKMGARTERGTLKAGSYFGDEIFSGNGAYGVTAMCLGTTTCWQLDAEVLKKTMGPLLQGVSD